MFQVGTANKSNEGTEIQWWPPSSDYAFGKLGKYVWWHAPRRLPLWKLHFVHNWSLVAAITMPMTMPVGRMISQQQLSSVYCYQLPAACCLVPGAGPLTPTPMPSDLQRKIAIWIRHRRMKQSERSNFTLDILPGPGLDYARVCNHSASADPAIMPPPTLLNTLAKGRASWNFCIHK